MISSHAMIALFIVIGYATVFAVIVIAILEAKRADKGEKSLLSDFDKESRDKK